jgi:two-component sensor histidine kinase
MWDWLTGIAYTAHGYCLSWDPWLISLHAGSDFLIFASYTAIPIAIWTFLKRRPGLELKGLAGFFAAFIFWCGLTHLLALVTLWQPVYDVQALIKAATAAVSVTTAIFIFRLIPQALAIPSPRELQLANGRLKAEAQAHESTLAELRQIRADLEQRVIDRTQSLEEAARHSQALVREVAHRSGNLMSVIAAMARQSAKTAEDTQQYVQQLVERIEGMGRSHELLFRESWRKLSLASLVEEQLRPFLGARPALISGPPVSVHPAMAHNLGMVIFELATNATKYGALSSENGNVCVAWHVVPDAKGGEYLVLKWTESGGPLVEPPRREGWGTTVIRNLAAATLDGVSEVEYAPEGLKWKLTVPLADGSLGRY